MKNSYGDRVGQFVFTNTKFNGECWLNVYTGEIVQRLPEQLEALLGNTSNTPVQVVLRKKPDIITLIRYVRPFKRDHYEIDNMKGTTFYIELDYNRKMVSFNYAMCDGENFEKDKGIQLAMNRYAIKQYQFAMRDGQIGQRGVLSDILEYGGRWLHRTAIKHFQETGY